MTTPNETMPLLVIEAEGKIITSNFTEFDTAARQWLADINRDLRTDEEFDQAAEDVKKAKQVEDLLSETRDAVLEKAETLNAELTRLSGLSSAMRDARLELSRQIEKAKADQKERTIEAALTQLACDKSMRPVFRAEIEAAAKGKKNLQSMSEAIRVAVSVANDRIGRAKKLLDEFAQEQGETLLPDRRNLEASDPVVLAGELRRRIEKAAAQAESDRLRKEAAEERQKADDARREAAKLRLVAEATTTPQAHPATKDDAPWVAEPETPKAVAESSDVEIEKGIDRLTEWNEFATTVKGAFAMLKPAREKLRDEQNILSARIFAEAVNAAWKGANK